MSRKVELRNEPVKGTTEPTIRQTLLIDGREVWSAEYWPGSEASCNAHDQLQAAASRRHDITQEEALQMEINAWSNG